MNTTPLPPCEHHKVMTWKTDDGTPVLWSCVECNLKFEPITAARADLEAKNARLREAWKHDCAALLANDVELWIDNCPHCGRPRAAPPAQQPHERHLLNLLARIHGDGGHYTAEHGLEKSVSDADQKVADLHLKAWEAQQPQYEAGDMASAHNDGFRAGVASVAQQAEAVASNSLESGGIKPQQAEAVPPGFVVERGFRWNGEKQQHIPQLVIEFEPVSANAPCDAQGWKDRDVVAKMFAAQGEKP